MKNENPLKSRHQCCWVHRVYGIQSDRLDLRINKFLKVLKTIHCSRRYFKFFDLFFICFAKKNKKSYLSNRVQLDPHQIFLYIRSWMTVHSYRIGVVIPFWLEWNGVIPFLQEWSGHSILAEMEWSFHFGRNGVLIPFLQEWIDFIPFLQEWNNLIPFQSEWNNHSIPAGM